jgi:hypothetical protein
MGKDASLIDICSGYDEGAPAVDPDPETPATDREIASDE